MLFKQHASDTVNGFWSLAIASSMQPSIFSFLPTSGQGSPASDVVPLFFPSSHHRQSNFSAAKEWSAADNFLQKQQKQRRPQGEDAGEALMATVMPDVNYNLKAKFSCRFAADGAVGDNGCDHLLHQGQPTAPAGWLSIAAAVMLVRHRNLRRAAA
jgi:hypothetical protein